MVPDFPITVAIPAYRGAATIRESIESLRGQSEKILQKTEILVVDDASNDDTPNAAQEAGQGLPCFRVHQNPQRLGITANWNNCIQLAQGDYILLLHQDDILHPRGLDTLFERIQGDASLGMVFGNTALKGQGPGMEASLPGWRSDHIFVGDEYVRYYCLHGNFIACSSVLYRRSALLKSGLFEERMKMLEDVEMWLRLALSGWKIGFVASNVACMQFHQGSAANTAMRSAETVQDMHLLLEKHQERLLKATTQEHQPLADLKRHMAFQFLGWGKAAMLHGSREAAIAQWQEAISLTEGITDAGCTRILGRLLLAFPSMASAIKQFQRALHTAKGHSALHRQIGGPHFPPPTER